MKTYKFHVNGMHCPACVALTESELGDLPHVSSVKADLSSLSVEIVGSFGDKHPELGSSVSKITSQDILGLEIIPQRMSGSGWVMIGSSRNSYTGFFEAFSTDQKIRITQTYIDFYTTEILIESINK